MNDITGGLHNGGTATENAHANRGWPYPIPETPEGWAYDAFADLA